jgi:outer membrane receptor protein involved in Fe transport
VNGALYRIDWTDMQVQGFAPAPFGPGIITYASNAGGSRIVGLELEADAAVSEHLSLDLSFNHFFEDELTKDAPVNPNGLAPKAGDPLSFNPQTSFNVGAEYHTPIFFGLDAAARMDWSYVGRRYTGFRSTLMNGQPNTLFNNLSPYNLVDLRLSAGKDGWRATFYVQNIADERAILQQQNPAPPNTETSRVVARPRTFGLMLNARY